MTPKRQPSRAKRKCGESLCADYAALMRDSEAAWDKFRESENARIQLAGDYTRTRMEYYRLAHDADVIIEARERRVVALLSLYTAATDRNIALRRELLGAQDNLDAKAQIIEADRKELAKWRTGQWVTMQPQPVVPKSYKVGDILTIGKERFRVDELRPGCLLTVQVPPLSKPWWKRSFRELFA
jgi:hypothetical protein